MNRSITSLVLACPFLWACGATFPPPTQRMVDAKAAERSAQELGANDVPDAKLSLKLAQEQIAMAEKAMADDENRRAESLLVRAKADAELSIAQAREKKARTETEGAIADSAAQRATNVGQGAVK